MRPGLLADRASYPRPRLSVYPGLKDSRMKSDLAASFLNSSRPSADSMSNVIPRLFTQ